MAQVVNFDGPNKLIIENAAGALNTTQVVEIYSEWKDWVRTGDNAKYLPAFTPVGGDPITDTKNLDISYFLENGWRLRPAELDHKWTLVGNLYTREPGQSVTVDTIGDWTVNVTQELSEVVRTIESIAPLSDSDKDDIINRLFLYILENGESFAETMRLIRAEAAGDIEVQGIEHRIKSADGTRDRIIADADETGRNVTSTDGT